MQKFFINSFILLEVVVIVHGGQDYYQILGLEKSCKEKDVKKAFRKLALKYHPDKNKEEGAEAKFIEIAEAYEVLADPKKRGQYDLLGHAAFTGNQKHSGGNDEGHHGPNFREKYNEEFFKKHHEEHMKQHQEAMKRHQEAVQEALKRAQNAKNGHNVHQETRTETHTTHHNSDIHQQHQEALKRAQNMHNNIHQQHQEALRQAQNLHKIHQQQQGAHFQKIHNIH